MGLWACPLEPGTPPPPTHTQGTDPAIIGQCQWPGEGSGPALVWVGQALLSPRSCPDFRQPGPGSHGPLHTWQVPSWPFPLAEVGLLGVIWSRLCDRAF